VPQSRAGRGTRPTTDRVRESLFNVLTARLDLSGAAVLDLYAGSGALGLEALSRGAASAVFVESDRRAAAVIEDNVRALGVTGAVVRCGSVAAVLAAGGARRAGLVFADPPYEVSTAEVEGVLVALAEGGWLQSGATVVVERPTSAATLKWPDGWTAGKDRRYGDTRLEFGAIA
jgi:16S rRNA (guanine966-N2)-methyltransferase